MEENYITKKIIKDAEKLASANIQEAKNKAADRIRLVKEQLEREEASALENAKKKAEQLAGRQKISAGIEARRSLGIKKRELLDRVLKLAKDDLSSGTRYDNLVAGLVKKYAVKGDEVRTSKHLPFLLVDKYKLKQIINKDVQGIIINNPAYELNLTIDELIKDFCSRNEGEIVKILWGS